MIWPRDLLTLDDWCGLPEISEYHVEVVEGVLLVAPRPRLLHQGATARLAYRVDEWLPHGFTALSGVEMVVSAAPLTVRVPDVLVAPSSLVETNPARLDAGDVRLVVEVLSEGTRRTDRLIEGDYENFGEFSGVAEIEFAGSPLTIDLDALTTRRAQRP
ncbi:Uma2 family endonuclease [Amycolatopsis sp. NPDC004772]